MCVFECDVCIWEHSVCVWCVYGIQVYHIVYVLYACVVYEYMWPVVCTFAVHPFNIKCTPET